MMEEARKQAAKRGQAENVKQLYNTDYAFLRQGQVNELWNDFLLHNKDQIPDFTEWRNKMSVQLVPPGVRRVLEVGIGVGHGVRFLSARFPDVEIYGTDISAEAVQHASSTFKGRFATADLGELPWAGLTFDAILMLEVLEHVEVPRTFQVLQWLRSMLADTGCLILSVPLDTVRGLRQAYFVCPHCHEPVHPIGHVRSYSELQPIKMELELSGLRIERAQGIAGGKYFGIPRQQLMPFFPSRIKPMVMIFRCRKASL
jgi:2-polyprenyl-3-methyl-5-hydroxy-6-metoxy-1,4-benzoquinol methylase